jgi:ribosomal protein S18 acetylase RimI-like enzyme
MQRRDGTFRIRNASVTDADALVELDRRLAEDGRGMVHEPDQTRNAEEERARIDAVYAGMSAGNATIAVVAELDSGAIAGSADLRQLGPALCKHVAIVSVGVDPAQQRRGIGRALMQHLVDHARACELVRLELYVRADNDRAHALYRSLGFEHEGTRRRFIRLADGRFIDDYVFNLFLR